MNIENDCYQSIIKNLNRTAKWRQSIQSQYDDPRCAEAAEICTRIANEATGLTPQQWHALEPFYFIGSPAWHATLSDATRLIGYARIETFDVFVNRLVTLLEQRAARAVA